MKFTEIEKVLKENGFTKDYGLIDIQGCSFVLKEKKDDEELVVVVGAGDEDDDIIFMLLSILYIHGDDTYKRDDVLHTEDGAIAVMETIQEHIGAVVGSDPVDVY